MLIINKHFNICCFRALAYTTLDRLVGHKRNACIMNRPNRSAGPQRVAAMQHFTAHTPTHNYTDPHHCNESRGDGEIKLACGCRMPVVVGALSPDRQEVIKMWKTKMTPCTTGSVNNTETMVLRDTGSTTCVVRSSLVKPEQMTGSYELFSPFSTICVDIIGPID